jgi:pimeloyl-ACP methyl ester carboxylesterase
MEPFFFGSSDSALFGVYHRPTGAPRDHGVLLCPPIGQEYVRSHWAMRQVAVALARAGFHALRFDWFAVGDSAGESREGSVERWVGDVALAAAELRDVAAVKRLSLVGLRLGATLAAAAMARGLRARDLVLWDPVVRGADYLEEMVGLNAVVRRDPTRFGFSLRRDLGKRMPWLIEWPEVDGELVGLPVPAALRAELMGLDIGRLLAAPPDTRVTVFCSEDRPSYRDLAASVGARLESADPPGLWSHPSAVEESFLPGSTVQAIARELSR